MCAAHLAIGLCPLVARQEYVLVDAAAVGGHREDGVRVLDVDPHRVDACMHTKALYSYIYSGLRPKQDSIGTNASADSGGGDRRITLWVNRLIA